MPGRQVTEEGEYVPPPAANSKASYATMVYVRATIVEDAGWLLARSVTIAVRAETLEVKTSRGGHSTSCALCIARTHMLPVLWRPCCGLITSHAPSLTETVLRARLLCSGQGRYMLTML